MIKLCKDFFGEFKLIQFGLATLAIHVFLLVMNPIFVDLLMNEGHVYSLEHLLLFGVRTQLLGYSYLYVC